MPSPVLDVPPPYLEGFLAAARPGEQTSSVAPAPPAPPEPSGDPTTDPDSPAADLSFEEDVKRRLHPLNSFPRLLECVSANRPPDVEDRFRFQWFGLFYQAPEQDAFTVRLRLPGGRLRPFQLAGLAEITQKYAGGQVVLNAQGGLDVPGVPVILAERILQEVESHGLSARGTGGDCVQAVRGGEYDDASAAEKCAPVYPLICALEQALARSPVFSDLPLPCEIVFRTAGETAVARDPGRCALLLRVVENREPARETSFLLELPGRTDGDFLLSTNRVVPGCLAVLKSWAASADRSSRENASLARFLAAFNPDALDALLGGAKRVPLPPEPTRSVPATENIPPSGIPIPGGRLLSAHLAALERCCREQNWPEIRLAHGRLLAVGAEGDGQVETTFAQVLAG